MPLGALAAVALCALSDAASADVDRTVVVVTVATPEPPVSASALETRVLTALADLGLEDARSGVQAVATARARVDSGAIPASALAPFRRAGDLLQAGWQAFVAADMDIARQHLEGARTAAEQVLGVQGGALVHADVSLRLAAVFMQQGAREQARDALAAVRALDPERAVTLAEFAPDVVEAYGQLGASAGLPHTVVVRGLPVGARVVIDGRLVGQAPVSVELTEGVHVLAVGSPGFVSHGRLWRVDATGGLVEFRLRPEPLARAVLALATPLATGMDRAELADALAGLTSYGGVHTVLLVASVWRAHEPALIGQRCAGVPTRCTGVVEIRYADDAATDRAIAELWTRLSGADISGEPIIASDPGLWPPRQVKPEARKTVARTKRKPCRLCRNPWLWTGVGAVLATTGTVLWMTREHVRTPVIIVDPCSFGGCAPRDSHRSSLAERRPGLQMLLPTPILHF